MAVEPLNLILGAAVLPVLAREVVDARRRRREQHAKDDSILVALSEELLQVRTLAEENLRQVFRAYPEGIYDDRDEREEPIDPLRTFPTRIDGLIRSAGPANSFRNPNVLGLLSRVITACS